MFSTFVKFNPLGLPKSIATLTKRKKEGMTRWFHKLRKSWYIKNSIHFALLVHRQVN
jgi:hypothetical protein